MAILSIESSRVVSSFSRVALVLPVAAMIGLAAAPNAIGSATGAPASKPVADQQVPAEKQTTLGLYLTAREAYEKWKAAPDKVTILDVRTPEEFLFIGHVEMAWNIPVAAQTFEWNAEKKQFPMLPLADFVARVQTIAKPGDTLLVMCRSGGRSASAVNQLAKAGFTQVFQITDGMEGDVVEDPASVFRGQRLVNGWKNSGLPWTYRIDPSRMALPTSAH
jgi:rhodanese-related sulfurtransferase